MVEAAGGGRTGLLTFDTRMLDPMPIGPAEFGPMIRATTAFWTEVLNEAGIRIEF